MLLSGKCQCFPVITVTRAQLKLLIYSSQFWQILCELAKIQAMGGPGNITQLDNLR